MTVAKETPSIKVSAYCPDADRKVIYTLSVEEGLLFECKGCEGYPIIVVSPNYVFCGVCYRSLYERHEDIMVCSRCGSKEIEWYSGWFYTGYRCKRCDSHDYSYKTEYYYLYCDNCRVSHVRSRDKILPINIGKTKLYCGKCNGELKLREKISVISATCIYCGVKRYCAGGKIIDIFSALCKSCKKETDWIETDICVMCLSCGLTLGK